MGEKTKSGGRRGRRRRRGGEGKGRKEKETGPEKGTGRGDRRRKKESDEVKAEEEVERDTETATVWFSLACSRCAVFILTHAILRKPESEPEDGERSKGRKKSNGLVCGWNAVKSELRSTEA